MNVQKPERDPGDSPEDRLEQSLSTAFDNSVDKLDQVTANSIRRVRELALSGKTGRYTGLRIPAFALASVCIAVIIYVILPENSQPVLEVDDFEMLSSTDTIELYEDLEFYQWLEDNDLSS